MESDPGEYHSELFEFIILLSADPLALSIAFAMIVVLLGCSALVSGSEVAYFSLGPEALSELKKNPTVISSRILKLLNYPRFLLATILIANNFINISIVMISTFITASLIPDEGWISIAVNVVLVTFLLVLFGEVAPKVYANMNSLQLASAMSGPLLFLRKISYPFAYLLVNSTKFIERRMEKRAEKSKMVSMEEIDKAIDLTVKDTQDAQQEAALLKSIVQFGNVSVQQIMRSRVDVVAVENDVRFTELLALVRKSAYSRIPVYEDNFDNVIGILYAKDLLEHVDKTDQFKWQKLVRPSYFVPETKKIDDLLENFQEKRTHMAIVVDEYGGTSGIVTLEDILEEIIGEIKDEFDEHIDLEYEKLDDHNFIFEGKTMLNDVCRITNLEGSIFDEVKGDSNSVAGLVLELAGRLPKTQEEITHDIFRFTIMSVDQRRIKSVKMTIGQRED
ncbi:MAG: gliding motility-associated protein GldE [Bacteroidota bacterium]